MIPTPMNELDRLTRFCNLIETVLAESQTGHLDPLEYKRLQNYISSKYGVDLPLKQPE